MQMSPCRWKSLLRKGSSTRTGWRDGEQKKRVEQIQRHSLYRASCSAPNFYSYLNPFCDCPFLFQDPNHSRGQYELTTMLKSLRDANERCHICFWTYTSYCLFQAHFWFHCVLLWFWLNWGISCPSFLSLCHCNLSKWRLGLAKTLQLPWLL